ncbi:MAG: DUF3824 domain-containing protein [Planctomycetes bacterium]|nr:DUF3824 domain-containing protein [Planctomycetota bacterium]
MSGHNPYQQRPNSYGAPQHNPYGNAPGVQPGYPQQYGQPMYPQQAYVKPHRAGTVKLMAWIGIFMWILALIALIFANQDLGEMRRGAMDASGYAETEGAKKVAIGVLIFHACMIPLVMIFYFWLAFSSSSFRRL